MKRFFALALCFVLLLSVFSVSAAEEEVKRGGKIDIIVSVEEETDIKSGSIEFICDESVFVLSGEWLVDAFVSDFGTKGYGKGVFAFAAPTSISGDLFKLTLSVKEDAALGVESLRANLQLTDKQNVTTAKELALGDLKIVCNHDLSVKNIDEAHLCSPASCKGAASYYYTCSICGEMGKTTFTNGEALPHTYDAGISCDDTCNECGAVRDVTHTPDAWAKDEESHTKSCAVCHVELDSGAHAWENEVTKKPEGEQKGERTYTCTVCGMTKTEEISAPMVVEKPVSAWKPAEGGTATFRSDAPFSEFVKVTVDGVDVPAEQYTVREGSTIVEISEAFLKTLDAGEHTLVIHSECGDAAATFSIEPASDSGEGENGDGGAGNQGGTGDDGNQDGASAEELRGAFLIGIAVGAGGMLVLVAIVGGIVLLVKKNKKKKSIDTDTKQE